MSVLDITLINYADVKHCNGGSVSTHSVLRVSRVKTVAVAEGLCINSLELWAQNGGWLILEQPPYVNEWVGVGVCVCAAFVSVLNVCDSNRLRLLGALWRTVGLCTGCATDVY